MSGKAKQWLSRLTGLSTPFFGVSWQPTATERDAASALLARFEDRRVLYNPSDAEIPHHCVQSVIEVRHILSDTLAGLHGDGKLSGHIRAMAAACRRFLDRLNPSGERDYDDMRSPGHYRSWEFLDALGQLRGIFGVHIALIAVEYDLDVRGDLINILPPEPSDQDFEHRSHRW